MEKWKKRTVELLTSLIFGGRGEVAVVPYYPQKTRVGGREEKFFKRVAPEKKGISSRRLYNMLCELESERRANVHSLLVLCDGEVICECAVDGYRTNEWHVSHSMAKTILGMVIGRLIEERKLSTDRRLVDIFPEIAYRDRRFPLITIDHLLSMTAGVDFAEIGVVTESDWTAAFFASSMRYTPGTKFSYNSMNSYVLARVAERVSGRNFGELANEYIFAPLAISDYLWEKGPEGTEKGGWGIYMSTESWAKVGYMLIEGGHFMGRTVLSEEWVRLSSSVKTIAPEEIGNFDYGYHIWTGRGNDELLFNGMLGQNVWICPQNRIVAVVMSGNNELFQDSPTLEIIRKYLGGKIEDSLNYRNIKALSDKQSHFFNCRRWARPRERGRGLLYLLGARQKEPFDGSWNGILGSYALVANNIGLMPLVLRAMQNNLDTSIEYISFYRRENKLYVRVRESCEEYTFAVGLYRYEESRINLRGEMYIVRSLGEATVDRRGNPIFKIEVIFPETASTRMIVIRKVGEGRIEIDMSERPNHRIAENLLQQYRQTSRVVSFASDMLERRLGRAEMKKAIERAFCRTLLGVDVRIRDYEKILDEERRIASAESGTVKIIRALVERFFSENKADE